jgi:TPR repeat protein
MRLRSLLPLLLLSFHLPKSAAAQHTVPSAQAEPSAQLQAPRWTEADRQALLVKARHGDVSSQLWLGVAYRQGYFGEPNLREARKWLRKAALHGDPDAQFSLGQMYEDGDGVKQNYVLAAKWYRKAAEHVPDRGGAGQGRNSLGMLYLEGLGVPKDYTLAYMWFRLTNFEPNRNLSLAKSHMSPTDILNAERLAKEWKLKHPEPH